MTSSSSWLGHTQLQPERNRCSSGGFLREKRTNDGGNDGGPPGKCGSWRVFVDIGIVLPADRELRSRLRAAPPDARWSAAATNNRCATLRDLPLPVNVGESVALDQMQGGEQTVVRGRF